MFTKYLQIIIYIISDHMSRTLWPLYYYW